MKIGSLFAGYGGLDLGVQAVLGGHMEWYSEIDTGACRILGQRFPDAYNIGDITKVDWAQVEPVDVLTGGSPCQDLSHAGNHAGMTEGTRSNLWVSMREAIRVLRPGLVCWENVRGAYKAAADSGLEPCPGCVGSAGQRGPVLRALGRVLGDLANIGYVGGWYGVRASDIGAPHKRFRVFVVAAPREGFAHLHRFGRYRAGGARDWGCEPTDGALFPTPAVNDMGEGKTVEHWDAWTAHHAAKHHNGNGHGKSLAIEVQRLLPTPTVQDSFNNGGAAQQDRRTPPMNALARDLAVQWGPYGPAVERWETLTRPAPAPTRDGKLNPAFNEWMMGLPEGWVTGVGLSRHAQLRTLGNGVVPQQASAAIRVLLDTLATVPERKA